VLPRRSDQHEAEALTVETNRADEGGIGDRIGVPAASPPYPTHRSLGICRLRMIETTALAGRDPIRENDAAIHMESDLIPT
jgi:hypothetical protein